MNRNRDRQITLAGLTAAAALLGLALASTLLPEAARRGLWLPIHLGLAGAGGTAVASVLPFFTTALAVARPARPIIRIAAIVLVATGALGVSAGVSGGWSDLAVAGGLCYVAGLIALAVAAFGTLRKSLGQRRGLLRLAYATAILDVIVGAVLATSLLASIGPVAERWALLKPAHAWLNVFGFLSLTVAATLVHLAPTVTGNRIRARRSATLAITGLIIGPPLIALGFAAGSDLTAQAGATVEVIGAAGLIVHALVVERDRGRWTTDPSWHRLTSWSLLAAPAWFLVATIVAGARIITMGAEPDAWWLPVIAAPLAIGWVAQVLIGAWSHLLPAVGPGDSPAHARQRAILGRGATARVVALNAGVALMFVGDMLHLDLPSVTGMGLVGACGVAALAAFVAAVWPGRWRRPAPGTDLEGA